MIIYRSTRSEFLADASDMKTLQKKLVQTMNELHVYVEKPEINSWKSSLTYMSDILKDSSVPDDAVIALEYNIPLTNRRIDMIVSGFSSANKMTAVIVELKGWPWVRVDESKMDIVIAPVDGGKEVVHPCYQAWTYMNCIWDYNSTVRDENIELFPCVCMHNLEQDGNELLSSSEYSDFVDDVRIFWKDDDDKKKFSHYLSKKVERADRGLTLDKIENGEMSPSKSLQDTIKFLLKDRTEFTLLDSQKVAYENILHLAAQCESDKKKRVVIVEGGPGTGKSVLAINLLCELIQRGLLPKYVSRNTAPRNVYKTMLKAGKKEFEELSPEQKKELREKLKEIDDCFMSSGNFVYKQRDEFPVLLVDEAHRLAKKSFQNGKLTGECQIKEIINASKLSVFFIDETQRVTFTDIGNIPGIEKRARDADAEITHCLLESQFRCGGSDGYIDWLNNALEIRENYGTERFDAPLTYDFKVCDDPEKMRKEIARLNKGNNKSRMLAGYCWGWKKNRRPDDKNYDIVMDEFGFKMNWNLDSTNTWAIDSGSIGQVGCVYTCQGLEFDYVGVIIGNDLYYDKKDGHVKTNPSRRLKEDPGFKEWFKGDQSEESRQEADEIIRNTYKVLLSRGMRGCYVYCTDKALADHLKSLTGGG